MKKAYKALFMLSLMASPLFFASCEKDLGTTDYEEVDDDDWKKKAIIVDYEGTETSSMEFTASEQ